MLTNNPNKRWYDGDPTVSMAISLLRNASQDKQTLVFNLIKDKGVELGIEVTTRTFKGFGLFKNRWYDSDEKLSNAMEVLRHCPTDIQKKVALDMINYLYNLELEQI
ncbi:MAG: hypothetical protein WCK67_04285 [bacterium]